MEILAAKVRAQNRYDTLEKETLAVMESAVDDHGDFSWDVFHYQHRGSIDDGPAWLAEQNEKLEKLDAEVKTYRATEVTRSGILDRAKANRTSGHNAMPVSGDGVSASLSKGIMAHADYKEFKARRGQAQFEVGINMKALFDTGESQGDTNFDRSDRAVPAPWRRLSIFDVIPEIQQDQPGVEYLQEDSPTTPAATYLDGAPGAPANMGIAEGANYPDTDISYQEVSRVMVKQGANVQVTEEALENDSMMRGRVDGKMLGNLRRYMEWNVFNGTATGLSSTDKTNLVGLRASTDINTLSGSGKDLYNAVNEAIDLCDLNGNADVSAILMQPQAVVQVEGFAGEHGCVHSRRPVPDGHDGNRRHPRRRLQRAAGDRGLRRGVGN